MLLICKFDEDLIKNKEAKGQTKLFFAFKRMQLYGEYSDLAQIRIIPRFYACPRYLQVWISCH